MCNLVKWAIQSLYIKRENTFFFKNLLKRFLNDAYEHIHIVSVDVSFYRVKVKMQTCLIKMRTEMVNSGSVCERAPKVRKRYIPHHFAHVKRCADLTTYLHL